MTREEFVRDVRGRRYRLLDLSVLRCGDDRVTAVACFGAPVASDIVLFETAAGVGWRMSTAGLTLNGYRWLAEPIADLAGRFFWSASISHAAPLVVALPTPITDDRHPHRCDRCGGRGYQPSFARFEHAAGGCS